MKYKVLHIATEAVGGAGSAMMRIHEELLQEGYESKVLVLYPPTYREVYVASKTPRSGYWYATKLGRFIRRMMHKHEQYLSLRDHILCEYARKRKEINFCFTLPISEYDLSIHPLVQWADIIHLHWIQDFVDYPSFFANVNKPILWTCHDLNPMMGGFHHVRLREKYDSMCGELEKLCYEQKKDSLSKCKDLSVVALSQEMHERLTHHEFFQNRRIFDIPNCVNTGIFTIADKTKARIELGVPKDAFVLLFANGNLNDSEKGLKELVEAIQMVDTFPSNAVFLCVGDGTLPTVKIPTIHIGKRHSPSQMAVVYQASDLLLFPSHQEAFPLTPIEAMACGTPVVITPVSGAEDMMVPSCGIIADDYTPTSIAKAISEALDLSWNQQTIRKHIVDYYSPSRIAGMYIEAYRHLGWGMDILLDNPILTEQHKCPNMLIEYDESCVDHSTCTIYFSSNGIYFPNEENVFRSVIIQEDRYEWYKTRRKSYKHIFVRDVYKQWYAEGINDQYNTIEKLGQLLIQETKEFRQITTIGSSSGGYAAVLFGKMVGADLVLAFCPQFDLHQVEVSGKGPLWTKHKMALAPYFNISWAITPFVYYIYPIHSTCDQVQIDKITVPMKNILRMDDYVHGVPMNHSGLVKLINMPLHTIESIPLKWTYTRKEFDWVVGCPIWMMRILQIIPLQKCICYRYRILRKLKKYFQKG